MTAAPSAPEQVMGRAEPRLWTRPLAGLSPATSLGYEVIDFADQVLGVDLLGWQKWWLVHALELNPVTGRFRFRTVLTLVGRQNGKTYLIKVLALWMLYVHGRRLPHRALVLGVAQSLDIARESWSGAKDLAEDVPELAAEIPRRGGVRLANGEITLTLTDGARYRIAAATRSAGRGLSVDLLVLDEIREHRTWDAWAALSKTTTARPGALTMCISNQGDDQSVVLNQLRSAALGETGSGPSTIGIFEWSGEDGCALDDVEALAQANPGLGVTVTIEALLTSLATDSEAVFRTEVLCQRVDALNAAISPAAWPACAQAGLDLSAHRSLMCWCVDVAYDDGHVSLAVAAPLPDGKVGVQVVASWPNTAQAREPLARVLETAHPRALGWFRSGPTRAIGAELTELHGHSVGQWNVARTELLDYAPGVIELTDGDAVEASMSLATLVDDHLLVHPDDPLLNQHIAASIRKDQGDGWRIARKGAGRNDAAYAVAGAVLLARRLPAVKPPPRSAIF